jgi:hypothetical protein
MTMTTTTAAAASCCSSDDVPKKFETRTSIDVNTTKMKDTPESLSSSSSLVSDDQNHNTVEKENDYSIRKDLLHATYEYDSDNNGVYDNFSSPKKEWRDNGLKNKDGSLSSSLTKRSRGRKKQEKSHGVDPRTFYKNSYIVDSTSATVEKDDITTMTSQSTTKNKNNNNNNNGTRSTLPAWKVDAEYNLLVQKHEQHRKQLETQRKVFRQKTQLMTFPLQDMAMERLLQLLDNNNNNSQFHGGEYLSSESSSSKSSVETSNRPRFDEPAVLHVNKNRRATSTSTTANTRNCDDIQPKAAAATSFQYGSTNDQLEVLWNLEPRIFAVEKAQGKRKYLVGHFGRIVDWYWRKATTRHLYEVIRAETACRLYFDLEYNKHSNPSLLSPTSLLYEFQLELAADLYMYYGLSLQSDQIINLDSSTEDKFSRHWIVRLTDTTTTLTKQPQDEADTPLPSSNDGVEQDSQREALFRDAPTVGRFVKRLVGRLADEIAVSDSVFAMKRPALSQHLFVHTKDANKKTCFIDLGVYTRNRLFRCLGSSKYGKTATLEVMQNEMEEVRGYNNNDNNEKKTTKVIHYHPLELPQKQQHKNNDQFVPPNNPPNGSTNTSFSTPLLSFEDFLVANDWEPYAKALADTLVVPLQNSSSNDTDHFSSTKATRILEVPLEGPYAGMTSANCSFAGGSSKSINFDSRGAGEGAIIQYQQQQQSRDRFIPVCIPMSRSGSPIPSLDKFVSEYLANRGGIQGSIRAWCIEYGPKDVPESITYQMQRNRFCELVGRVHKSNNVFWTIDFGSWTCMQGCHDPDCHGRGCPVLISNQNMILTNRDNKNNHHQQRSLSYLERIKDEFDKWQEIEFEKALMALDLDDVVTKKEGSTTSGFSARTDHRTSIKYDNNKDASSREDDGISDTSLSDDALLKAMMENPDLFP